MTVQVETPHDCRHLSRADKYSTPYSSRSLPTVRSLSALSQIGTALDVLALALLQDLDDKAANVIVVTDLAPPAHGRLFCHVGGR